MIILVIDNEVLVLDDRRLIREMKRGSKEALERLYEKYEGFLITVAVALCHRMDIAPENGSYHDQVIMLGEHQALMKTIPFAGDFENASWNALIDATSPA